ncbi:hypothetical protein CI238_02901 [Colletotrichum incanum]|uniref:Uncharacterized protein n=1 Tax=Colletotrichum incanum TaxID=1573173 RepID=A0A166LIB3_COLIC|nr:hypothetical protein CI238_02901 [Colletotrichum incanum]
MSPCFISLSLSLAYFVLATLVVGGGVSVHLEPLSLPPSFPNNFLGRTGTVKNHSLSPRSLHNRRGILMPVGDTSLGSRSIRSSIFRHPSFSPAPHLSEEAPFELHPIDCHNPDYPEFKSHPDVHRDAVEKGAERFCESDFARETLTTVDDVKDHPLHAWRWRYKDHMRVYQDYKVHWRVNCRTKQGFQDIGFPLGPDGPSCVEIMADNFRKCEIRFPSSVFPLERNLADQP